MYTILVTTETEVQSPGRRGARFCSCSVQEQSPGAITTWIYVASRLLAPPAFHLCFDATSVSVAAFAGLGARVFTPHWWCRAQHCSSHMCSISDPLPDSSRCKACRACWPCGQGLSADILFDNAWACHMQGCHTTRNEVGNLPPVARTILTCCTSLPSMRSLFAVSLISSCMPSTQLQNALAR